MRGIEDEPPMSNKNASLRFLNSLLITHYSLLPVRPFKIELEEMLLRGKRLTTKLSVNSSWELK